MQITLNQEEINAAVENYARAQINIAPNQSLDIDFVAGRGANGLSATLDIRTNKGIAAAPKVTREAVNTPTAVETKAPEAVAEKPEDKPADTKSLFKSKATADTDTKVDEPTETTTPKSVFAQSAKAG